jgi:hypothetical protein
VGLSDHELRCIGIYCWHRLGFASVHEKKLCSFLKISDSIAIAESGCAPFLLHIGTLNCGIRSRLTDYSATRSATITTMMRTADSTRTHSLLMASAASAVPKTVKAAPAIQKISVVVCGGVLAKKIKPTMASIFKKIEVPEMSSFTRRLSCLRAYPDLSDVDKGWSQDAKQIGQKVKMPPQQPVWQCGGRPSSVGHGLVLSENSIRT